MYKKIPGFVKQLYQKLFLINDSPQRISLGLGLGIFLGIFPGVGPLAALSLALLLRINRASALLGCLLTNTWLSFVTFFLAIKLGSRIFGIDWQGVYKSWVSFLEDFSWANLFKLSILKVIFPVIVGYLAVALILGLLVYLITLIVITRVRDSNKNGARIIF